MSKFSNTTKLKDIATTDELRLDATYYLTSVFLAKKCLSNAQKKGIPLKTIRDFSFGSFNPPPIKRIFTDNKEIGTPYMIPQEMFDFFWEPRKFVLADKMDDIDKWFLKDGWTVLTQSGTVGKPFYSTEHDEKYILSQNAIRIPPKQHFSSGYIYAYLSTWIGQSLLKKDEFGITVKHIRPHHVDSIPIPDIDKKIQEKITKNIQRAFLLRAESIELIKEAKKMIYHEIDAPDKLLDDEATEEL